MARELTPLGQGGGAGQPILVALPGAAAREVPGAGLTLWTPSL